MKDWKHAVRDAYNFVFHGDSFASLTVFFILAYITLKYVAFPLIGFLVGSPLPMVAVISNSMHHGEGWWQSQAYCNDDLCTQEAYYESQGITRKEFESFRFDNGLNVGDIMLVRGENSYEVGDVIVYQPKQTAASTPTCESSTPIIHRVIKPLSNEAYIVKGDNNPRPIGCQGEKRLPESRILGSAYARIPWAGWVKIMVTNPVTTATSLWEAL